MTSPRIDVSELRLQNPRRRTCWTSEHERAFLAAIGVTRLIELPTDWRAAPTSA